MKTKWIFKGIGMGVMIVGFMILFGYITMLLWNWLMPEIFGLTTITFWQAAGLMLLGRALTGTSGKWGRGRSSWKNRMKRKYENMGPEQRENWRKNMEQGCGGHWKSRSKESTDANKSDESDEAVIVE